MTFEEWTNEIEGFGLRIERLVEDILIHEKPYQEKYKSLIEWIREAYRVGYEQGLSEND